MGITDAFAREDRAELKVSELVSYFRHEGRTNAKNEIMINGLKADIPASHILTMIGETKNRRGGVIMDYKKAWERLKSDAELAVDEGYDRGFNNPDSPEHGKFYVWQYVLDEMKRLEDNEEV